MSNLPPPKTPLNQHSLGSLEFWLISLGAEKSIENPCLWNWITPNWSAQIHLKQNEIMVVWTGNHNKEEQKHSQFSFPYGLSRQDVEAALQHGP